VGGGKHYDLTIRADSLGIESRSAKGKQYGQVECLEYSLMVAWEEEGGSYVLRVRPIRHQAMDEMEGL